MIRHIRILSIFSLLLCLPPLALAQNTWSLERCIDHALSHNLQIKQQQLAEERSRNDLRQSYANLFPSLNAGSSQGYNYGRTVDPFTNEFATERVAFQRMSASSGMMLFAGFQNVNNIRYHLEQHTAFRHDTEKMKNDIVLAIASAFLQVMYFEDLVVVNNQQLEVMEEQLRRTRLMMEGGSVSRGTYLEIEAQTAQERVNLLNAKNNLDLALLELVHILDLDPADEFIVQRPDLQVEENILLQDEAAVLDRALVLEPSVQAARQRILMAERHLAISRGEQSPRLSFYASYGSGYSGASRRQVGEQGSTPIYEKVPYKEQIEKNVNQGIGLELNIPIFNRLQTRRRIQNARIDLENSRLTYELTRNNLGKTIQQAHADASAALQRYEATIRSQDAYREAFRHAEQQFNLGTITSMEYNESKARLARSEMDALQAKYDFIFKQKILDFYQGEGFSL